MMDYSEQASKRKIKHLETLYRDAERSIAHWSREASRDETIIKNLVQEKTDLLLACEMALIWAENDNTKKLLQEAIDKAKRS